MDTITGTPPAPGITVMARLILDRAAAWRAFTALSESVDPEQTACSLFETAAGCWTITAHFRDAFDHSAMRALIETAAGPDAARALAFETIAETDWVAASLAGLAPVQAGRFVVHGAHDRARVPANRIGIEIEAALAFGTGHHGTTRGCLLALDRLVKSRHARPLPPPERVRSLARNWAAALPRGRCAPSPRRGEGWGEGVRELSLNAGPPSPCPSPLRGEGTMRQDLSTLQMPDMRPCSSPKSGRVREGFRILDIGTGTGVLAIAAARALRQPVLASDADPRAVFAARGNARLNRAACLTEILCTSGLTHRRFRERGPFDLVLANILLGPLRELARPIAGVTAPRARIVLSGLLATQADAALAAYRLRGLALERKILLDGWVTLVLRRGA